MKFTYEIEPYTRANGSMMTYHLVKAKNSDAAHEMAMEIYPDADYYMISCDTLGQCGPYENAKNYERSGK